MVLPSNQHLLDASTLSGELVGVPIFPSPKVCLLGLVEDQVPSLADRPLSGLLLFYARKTITLFWKKQAPPPLSLWKQHVDTVIPLYKDAYRGCPKNI